MKCSELFDKHFNGEDKLFECELRIKHKKGYWVWTLSSGRMLQQDDTGMPTRMIGTLLDISSRKQAEMDLIQAKDAAEKANNVKGDYLANISHEIRTPMNGVLGMTELLLDHELNPEQENRALTIKRRAESLLTVINDILDFSRIEAGKLELETIEFDLAQLMEDIADIFSLSAFQKGLEFICSVNLRYRIGF